MSIIKLPRPEEPEDHGSSPQAEGSALSARRIRFGAKIAAGVLTFGLAFATEFHKLIGEQEETAAERGNRISLVQPAVTGDQFEELKKRVTDLERRNADEAGDDKLIQYRLTVLEHAVENIQGRKP